MIDVGLKIETQRSARAEAFLKAAPATLELIQSNGLPKKDPIATARAAGLLAAKKTPEWIPHCHPLPLDKVSLDFAFEPEGIRVTAEAVVIAKTGVEMEALTACSAAALTLYDMAKCVDEAMEITGVKLVEKRGGKSDFKDRPAAGFKAAVIVSSDRVSKGAALDKCGPLIAKTLEGYGVQTPELTVIPDEPDQLRALLLMLCERGVDLVLTTGGTGLSARDRTVETVQALLEREIPGMMEAARGFGQRRTPYAMLSRGVAGQRGRTLIVTLPGSSGGVKESLAALFPALFHAYKVLKQGQAGQPEPHAHVGSL